MGGGFAGHAMNIIKANRALLNKRKRLKREDYIGNTTVTKIKAKKATPAQMRTVKLQLTANKRAEIKIWILSFCLSIIILYGLYYWMVN